MRSMCGVTMHSCVQILPWDPTPVVQTSALVVFEYERHTCTVKRKQSRLHLLFPPRACASGNAIALKQEAGGRVLVIVDCLCLYISSAHHKQARQCI